jgi:hypothetical protein
MVDLNNIKQFTTDRPNTWTLFGSADDFDNLPKLHREQIHFLDKTAGKYIYGLLSSAKLVADNVSNPFSKGNFKSVVQFSNFAGTPESKQELKKWLFQRGITFQTQVFVLPNYNDYPVVTTWKILIKYANDLFFNDDVTVFDQTLNWCLFYYHHDQLFFGRDNIYDPSEDERKMEVLNERKRKYPQFKFPY